MGNAILIEPLALGTVTAGSGGSAAGTVPGNLDNDWIGVVHRSGAVSGTAEVLVDFGAAQGIDTISFLNTNRAAVDINILASNIAPGNGEIYAPGPQTFPAGSVLPTSGRSHSLTMLPSPLAARYWYFGLPQSGSFEAGRLVMGSRIKLARNFSFGGAWGVIDRGGGEFSDDGVWLPRSGVKQRTIGISFAHVTKQEAETQLHGLLERIGNSKMLLLVTDPDPTPDNLRMRRMYFGPLQGSLETLWRTSQGWEWRANMISVI